MMLPAILSFLVTLTPAQPTDTNFWFDQSIISLRRAWWSAYPYLGWQPLHVAAGRFLPTMALWRAAAPCGVANLCPLCRTSVLHQRPFVGWYFEFRAIQHGYHVGTLRVANPEQLQEVVIRQLNSSWGASFRAVFLHEAGWQPAQGYEKDSAIHCWESSGCHIESQSTRSSHHEAAHGEEVESLCKWGVQGQGQKHPSSKSSMLQLATREDQEFEVKKTWSELGGSSHAQQYLQNFDVHPQNLVFSQMCDPQAQADARALCQKHLGSVAHSSYFEQCVDDVCSGRGEGAAEITAEMLKFWTAPSNNGRVRQKYCMQKL